MLESLRSIDREIPSESGRWLVLGLRPYRTVEGHIDGVVLTLMDITSRKSAEAALKQELDASRLLQQLSTKTVQSEQLAQPLNEVLGAAIELVGADFGNISLFDEGKRSLQIAAQRGFSQQYLDRYATVGAFESSAQALALNKLQPIAIDDVDQGAAARSPLLAEARLGGFRSVLSIPLTTAQGKKIVGVLSVHFREPHQSSLRDARIVDICARIAADAIDVFRLRQEQLKDHRHRNEFLAVLAHELRNPLAPISNALQTLRRLKPGTVETERLYNIIGRQVEHLARLVSDLLDISRITQGKIDLRPQLLDVNDILRNVVQSSAPAIERRRHTVNATFFPKPLPVFGDPIRLTQVFGNLLSNAIRYTPEGGVIEVSSAEANGDALVKIRDNGVGVSPDMLPQIFELFVQASQGSQGGIGVGLALARTLVSLHGGSIEAHSDGLGKGSEFVVRLPVRDAALPTTQAGDGKDARKASPPRPAGRALVVDDKADVAIGLAMLLESLGADAHAVNNGPDALAAL